MLARARRGSSWADHSRDCPICLSTIASGSGDALPIGGRARRRILRQVARSELGKAAAVGIAADADPLVTQVRVFLQALCPQGQRLLLPVLTSAGQAALPGTASKALALLYDAPDLGDDDLPDLFYARWARRDRLEDPVLMDRPATLEIAFEEWAWYSHRWTDSRLAGMEEARRCIDSAEAIVSTAAELPWEARFVAQRIRRCALLGANEGWVDGNDLLGGLAWPDTVRTGLSKLRGADLLKLRRDSGQSEIWYSIKEVSHSTNEAA